MRCFACNAEIAIAAGERLGFRDDCSHCGADLHTCKNCAHHDPSAYNECRESNAERVGDRERANRCDYFSASSAGQEDPGGDPDSGRAKAQSDLEGLFKK